MRDLPVRRIASTALGATLLLGVAAPAAAAADAVHERSAAASRAPVPGVDALLAQIKGLSGPGTVLTPVTDLLDTALEADDGELTAEQATQLGDAVEAAIAEITATTPVPVPSLPTDPETEALETVQDAVAELLAAAASGNATSIVTTATGLATGLVGLVVATLNAAGLPLPNLPNLPNLPSVPGPPLSASEAPVSASSLPATPSLPDSPPAPQAANLLPAP
ncbi:hypothetical protein [Streptomyces sp. NPDC096132]|uniref:hypothetical protein n=1 Tax=Streptomyces sp. NPDC096132 TaxID=3366075 RepID=UPI003801E204